MKDHLALRRDQQATEFPLYRSGPISLVVSGVGGRAAEKAVHWLAARQEKAINPIWVNLGIAGHPNRPLGQAVLAAEIEDDANGHRWHTRLPVNPPCDSARLITLVKADDDYERDALYDMEAAGFYPAARLHTVAERVQCLKFVSDNRLQPSRQINAKMVSRLIAGGLDTLDQLLQRLVEGR